MNLLEQVSNLAKRRGFIYPSSEIYGGISGFWDYGPYGVELKNNIKRIWWQMFVQNRDDVFGVDASIIMNPKVWEASGHVAGFSDPLVQCTKCKKRFRADHILTMTNDPVKPLRGHEAGNDNDAHRKCPECDGVLGEARQFNMMFQTRVGATEDASSIAYLRPETAGGIFVNFKNVVDSLHPKIPFGIAQIGKAFRNEIAPRDFIFRLRELEQMEIEYFVRPKEWEEAFKMWQENVHLFNEAVGIPRTAVHELEVPKEDRAHYSKRTIDFEFDFPFGRKELYGLAYRTDYDLSAHAKASGADLTYLNDDGKRFVPHVIEPSFGVDRTVLAVLTSAYAEDEVQGEKRTYLRLNAVVAPVKVAIFPLLANKPDLVRKAREIYKGMQKSFTVAWDERGNIGKRYRSQDEIGTPYCVTVDFDSLNNDDVTVRDRDTMKQERVPVDKLKNFLTERVNFEKND